MKQPELRAGYTDNDTRVHDDMSKICPLLPTNEQLCVELSTILTNKRISTLFQPIVDVQQIEVFGYEALSRGPSDSPLHAAPILFETAERCEKNSQLELCCLNATLEHWQQYSLTNKVFINMNPEMLMHPGFGVKKLLLSLKKRNISASSIVIEMSERFPITNIVQLKLAVTWLREQGFLIAIDDLGAGYSGLKLWSDLKPDFVKIDRHFIRDIHEDLVKREFVRSLVDLSERIGCEIIAEGVETSAELAVVKALNIHLIQGFYFGRPRAIPNASLELCQTKEMPQPRTYGQFARDLSEYIEPVSSKTSLKHAWDVLQKNPTIFSLPIVDDGRPLGLLHRWRVLELYGSQYGRALYEKHPVIKFINKDSLIVDVNMSLDDVSQRLIDEDYHYLKQHFIVVEQGYYLGMGTTRSLLKQLTQQRIQIARYANPLTQLPGNVPIKTEVEKRIERGESFYFAYVDISHFKPLNDYLGYKVGDTVILKLSVLLKSTFTGAADFVGHIGGMILW
ncbi:EAL domain-containing protein [Nitrincola nitratireducens]|uniref:Uncharacterized protein n=1 Tax=Nitrincola nitratireducens TaxID=1229521 RepID=W9VGD8_9GAMM|nr:EAL domain-containing protein [Nitrincola nitratireducens]EXJ09720.1 hypothetical protein D791_03392 [Nitrincola nitratireducens]